MNVRTGARSQLRLQSRFEVRFISFIVGLHGLVTLASILLAQIAVRHNSHLRNIDFDVPLLVGLSLLFLSAQLRRQKRTAWIVAIGAYLLYLLLGVTGTLSPLHSHEISLLEFTKTIILPLVILALLVRFQKEYIVRSDIEGFRAASRFAILILIAAFLYGVVGIQLMDQSDFHREFSAPTAAHYTLDQFNITTAHPLHPYTKRAHLFVASLSFVSTGALLYAAISLFQPLRARLSDQSHNRQLMLRLLSSGNARSEDFFKLWPHDKQFFFNGNHTSGLAFHVQHGVALCLGDPAGQARQYRQLLEDFVTQCHRNDWLPAFIHIQDKHRKLYEQAGFTLQKIGQEAIVDITGFQADAAHNKYFRHIRNKFTKQSYTTELLQPPHHAAVIDRLKVISEDWLQADGRIERRFVMGYYAPEYMQQCRLMVVRDAAGTIRAFVSLVPAEFDKTEATFDMLRHTKQSPGNINDYLLLNLIDHLESEGYEYLNLGLCPLVGLSKGDEEANKLIDGFLRFAYANGDRFYSFSGLHRFKAKFEPEWRNRYVAYQNGISGFTRTMTALMRAVRVKN